MNAMRIGFRKVGPAALAIFAVGLSGCSHHGSSPAPAPGPGSPLAAAPQTQPATPAVPTTGSDVVVYKLADSSNQSSADANGLAPAPFSIPAGSVSPAKDALTDLVDGPNSPLPKGTRLLSLKIDRQSKLATVDFSRQFRDNFQGGETREAQAVMSVVETLGQFPDVRSVQFLVAGRKIDSLGGTEELDQPLPTPEGADTIAATTETRSSTGGP